MKQPNDLLISVVITVYNNEKYISDAINSVLQQQYSPLEIICVNDGSSDASVSILESFGNRIRVISQPNEGVASARNTGIRAANGEVIGLLDGDDMWTDDHLELLLPHVMSNTPYDLARGATKMFYEESSKTEEIVSIPCLVGTALYKSPIFQKIGYFDKTIRGQGDDFDWHARFKTQGGKEKVIDQPTLLYRRHPRNFTQNSQIIREGIFDSLRKKIKNDEQKSI